MRFIQLTQYDARAARSQVAQTLEALGEDDGHEDVASASTPTRPVDVNPEAIRSMTDRREGPGTRITFTDGGGFSVTEDRASILSMVNPS